MLLRGISNIHAPIGIKFFKNRAQEDISLNDFDILLNICVFCIFSPYYRRANNTTMYSAGDLIQFDIANKKFYGEIVGIDEHNKLEVSRIQKTTKQEGRIWEFVDDDKWSTIDPKYVSKHVQVDSSKGASVVNGWRELGFLAGGDGMSMCKLEDESQTTLPIFQGDPDSDDEDGEQSSSNPQMHGYVDDGFVVPDDEGSEFEFADPSELDDEAAEWVRETHEAVREYDKWQPNDKQGKALKTFIDKMDHKAAIDTDNQRLEAGKESISTSKPPVKKKRKRK